MAENGEESVITMNGKPVAKLTPYPKIPNALFGIDRGRYGIIGAIDGALSDLEWNSEPKKNRGLP